VTANGTKVLFASMPLWLHNDPVMTPSYPRRSVYVDDENWDWLVRRTAEKKSDSVSAILRQLLDEVRKAEEEKEKGGESV
jgi:hypothetical protein